MPFIDRRNKLYSFGIGLSIAIREAVNLSLLSRVNALSGHLNDDNNDNDNELKIIVISF